MFFRRFNFNLFYINFSRLSYFIILFYFMLVDLNSNLFICSYIKCFFIDLNTKSFFLNLFMLIINLLIVRLITSRKRNLINFFLIDSYLLVLFYLKNLGKYLTFLNNNFLFSFSSNFLSYFKNNIFYNSKYIYIYITVLTNMITRNFKWYPLYKKLSYYGYFRSSRFNNSLDYEKNLYSLKN